MEIILVVLLVAVGVVAVIRPLARGQETARPRLAHRPLLQGEAEIEAEVLRYRDALRAGTICSNCRYPNPEASSFCADCGRPLQVEARR